MMQTIQNYPALGTHEAMNQLNQHLVHMTKISETMMKNREISKKIHQLGQTVEQYRTASRRGVKINWEPMRKVIS